jgi:hypothetical protein
MPTSDIKKGPLYVDSTNNRVGIGETSPDRSLHITGTEPSVVLENSGQGTDLKTWRIYSNSSSLQIGTVDDAFASGQNALEITRDNTDNITGIQFKTGASSEIARFTTSGLTFNGDTAAANALDDYEEGTLVPTLSCTGGNTGIVYAAQVGRYVKIGNMVHVNLYLELSSKGSASGNVRISGAGFPFTPINTTGFVQVGQVSLNGTVNGQQFDGSNDIWGQLSPGDATLRIYADSDGDVVQLDTGDISGTSFRVNISYFV